MCKPSTVSSHTADGNTTGGSGPSGMLTRCYGLVGSATTAGTIELKRGGSSGTVFLTLKVALNLTDSITGIDIPVPEGIYVDITTFAGKVEVLGG